MNTSNALRPTGQDPSAGSDRRPALIIESVSKSFGRLEVLRGVDLEVAEHEVVCLIGASGSGKSTLLRCINLLEPIDGGRIVVGGESITDADADVNRIRRRIGIVFQAFNLFPHLSVVDNIALAPTKVLRRPGATSSRKPMRSSHGSGCSTNATNSRIVCPAGNSNAWPSFGPLRCSPSSCFWTRSQAPSIRS